MDSKMWSGVQNSHPASQQLLMWAVAGVNKLLGEEAYVTLGPQYILAGLIDTHPASILLCTSLGRCSITAVATTVTSSRLPSGAIPPSVLSVVARHVVASGFCQHKGHRCGLSLHESPSMFFVIAVHCIV